ncbi:hypothetical protein J6590_050671 [Homalodisca vitripennis]|nr:hypothetical protein J6590_050671 [Homalodisca vitripennis]
MAVWFDGGHVADGKVSDLIREQNTSLPTVSEVSVSGHCRLVHSYSTGRGQPQLHLHKREPLQDVATGRTATGHLSAALGLSCRDIAISSPARLLT